MDVKCPGAWEPLFACADPLPDLSGCFSISTVFSHAQTVVICSSCSSVLCQPTGGRARLTEGNPCPLLDIHLVLNSPCTRQFIPSEELSILCHVSAVLSVCIASCTPDASHLYHCVKDHTCKPDICNLIQTLVPYSDTPSENWCACVRPPANDGLRGIILLASIMSSWDFFTIRLSDTMTRTIISLTVECTCVLVGSHLRLGLRIFLTRRVDLSAQDPLLIHDCQQCSILIIQLSRCEHSGSCLHHPLTDWVLTSPEEKARPSAAAGDVICIFSSALPYRRWKVKELTTYSSQSPQSKSFLQRAERLDCER